MVRTLTTLAVLLAAVPARAVILAPLLKPAELQALRDVKRGAPRWQPVSLRVAVSADGRYQITEPFLRVFMTGKRESDGRLIFSGFAGQGVTMIAAQPFADGYSIFGSGASLTLRPFGRGYLLQGSVDGGFFDAMVDVSRGAYRVWSNGVSLTAWSGTGGLDMSGSVELDRVGPRGLVAVAVALTALQSGPQPAK